MVIIYLLRINDLQNMKEQGILTLLCIPSEELPLEKKKKMEREVASRLGIPSHLHISIHRSSDKKMWNVVHLEVQNN